MATSKLSTTPFVFGAKVGYWGRERRRLACIESACEAGFLFLVKELAYFKSGSFGAGPAWGAAFHDTP